jgi:hypothetical protein
MSKLEEFEFEELVEDTRNFSEKVFFNQEGSELQPKKVAIVDCPKGDPETFPSDRIIIMRKYKVDIERGRKDPLKGEDVLVLMTDKGPYQIPLNQAMKFASYLYSVANSSLKKLESE